MVVVHGLSGELCIESGIIRGSSGGGPSGTRQEQESLPESPRRCQENGSKTTCVDSSCLHEVSAFCIVHRCEDSSCRLSLSTKKGSVKLVGFESRDCAFSLLPPILSRGHHVWILGIITTTSTVRTSRTSRIKLLVSWEPMASSFPLGCFLVLGSGASCPAIPWQALTSLRLEDPLDIRLAFMDSLRYRTGIGQEYCSGVQFRL